NKKVSVLVKGVREIAIPLGLGRDGNWSNGISFRLTETLIGTEEVQMMTPGDRPTKSRPKLIAMKQALGRAIAIIRPAISVEGRVPHVVIHAAVIALAAAPGHQRDHAGTGALILRVVDVLHHLLFLH